MGIGLRVGDMCACVRACVRARTRARAHARASVCVCMCANLATVVVAVGEDQQMPVLRMQALFAAYRLCLQCSRCDQRHRLDSATGRCVGH
jgi:hypothetical protein